MRAVIGIVLAIGLAFGVWFAWVRLQKEPDPFEGKWTVLISEKDGELQTKDELNGRYLLFAGHNIAVYEKDQDQPIASFMYGADKTLNEGPIQFLPSHVDTLNDGIFKFVDNRLWLLIQLDKNKEKPRDFETKKDSGRWKIVLQRS